MPTITPDTIPNFPVIPNYGFSSAPIYAVDEAQLEGGFVVLNRLWSRPLIEIAAVPLEDATIEDMEQVLNFYHAVGGGGSFFRMKDYVDFKSCGVNETPTALDQPLVNIGGSNYQMTKQYEVGSLIQVREIYKPVGNTILVANNSNVAQTDFTVNEGTGVIVAGGGFTGTPAKWGGEFMVEVYFTSRLQIDVSTYGTRGGNVSMRERRRPATT